MVPQDWHSKHCPDHLAAMPPQFEQIYCFLIFIKNYTSLANEVLEDEGQFQKELGDTRRAAERT
jgi:hypothetical protein